MSDVILLPHHVRQVWRNRCGADAQPQICRILKAILGILLDDPQFVKEPNDAVHCHVIEGKFPL